MKIVISSDKYYVDFLSHFDRVATKRFSVDFDKAEIDGPSENGFPLSSSPTPSLSGDAATFFSLAPHKTHQETRSVTAFHRGYSNGVYELFVRAFRL